MCLRNCWENEPTGHMDLALFDRLIDEIPDSVTRIFFGGVGEPLYHPDIVYMLRRAKETGRTVEAITNGTLLSHEMSRELIDVKLDTLWLSLDSMEEKYYENIRTGAVFNSVIENIRIFNKINFHPYLLNRPEKAKVKLGISFILMKNNLEQFKMLLTKARQLGVTKIKATHLVPYDKSLSEQTCYERMLGRGTYNTHGMYGARGITNICLDMPFMETQDIQEYDILPLISNPPMSLSISGNPLRMREGYCRFVQEGATFVRWDGEVCPCMALLHENMVYQQGKKRHVRSCSYGNSQEKSLLEIWESENYEAFRK
jgi:MoaA/NifB/PqqE/SkfB family radical SAM enzyme